MTTQIFVLSASSLEAGDSIDRDKRFLWSRFHQDYQYNNNNKLKSQNSAGEEVSTEDSDRDLTEEEAEIEQEEEEPGSPENEDIEAEEEDIFTKSLAPEHLDLKNFLIVEDRRKKISQISEIIAYNIDKRKQVRVK